VIESYRFLADEDELKWFWQYGIPPLRRNEIYFCSLSARNKRLSEGEREIYKVSRSEMFAKTQIRHDDYGKFLQAIKGFEVRKDAILTKSGVPYPDKALVLYFNICPIDAYSAMKDQINYLTEVMSGLTDAALKNSQSGLDDCFHKVRKSFDSCQSLFARNFGEKHWIDIDVDMDEVDERDQIEIREIILAKGQLRPGDLMMIRTAGGLHCLIRRSCVKWNPQIVCEEIEGRFKGKTKEVAQNKNLMCAMPGTLMYGDHIVRIVNKEDFGVADKLHFL